MTSKTVFKMTIDCCLTILLLLLVAFELVGRQSHEWIGMGMFLLFVLHHIMNWRWSKNLFRGTYPPYRILQTLLVALIFCSMIGSMASGIVLSRYVFDFLEIDGGRSIARTVHMLCAYWGFVLMSFHLGLHWGVMIKRMGPLISKPSPGRTAILRIASVMIAAYGLYAFVKRGIGTYLFLQTEFVFFDFEEPLFFFFVDYLAVMGFFVFLGHYLAKGCKKLQSFKGERS